MRVARISVSCNRVLSASFPWCVWRRSVSSPAPMSPPSSAIRTLLELNTNDVIVGRFANLLFPAQPVSALTSLMRVVTLTSALAASNRPHCISCAVIAFFEHDPSCLPATNSQTPEHRVLDAISTTPHASDPAATTPTQRRRAAVEALAKIREALFKSFAVIGIPKAINGLTCFKTVSKRYPTLFTEMETAFGSPDYYPKIAVASPNQPQTSHQQQQFNNQTVSPDVMARVPRHASAPQILTPEEQRMRGVQLFDAVYGRNTLKLKRILDGLHPAFLDCIVDESYGRVLGEMCIIGALETEYVMYAALKAQGGLVERQATSHMIGAKRFGATDSEIKDIDNIIKDISTIPIPLTDDL